ncbi:hypothetical protein Tco_0893197 [Tanacetum coccineum]|uniref:Uncharacterized protein n=1 Tax=Tanacetum coccineum TaxID=301880 RepID=A0ABQ5C841_9ASTR
MSAKATLMTLLKMFGDFQKLTPVASNVGHENLRQSCSVGSFLVNDVENRNMGLENIRLRDTDLGTHHILTEVVEAKVGTGHWLQGGTNKVKEKLEFSLEEHKEKYHVKKRFHVGDLVMVTPNLYGNLVANTAAAIAGATGVMPGDSTSSYYAGQKRKQLETQTRINIHIPGTRSQFGHRRGKKRIIDTDLGTHHILTEVVEAKAGTGHWLQGGIGAL